VRRFPFYIIVNTLGILIVNAALSSLEPETETIRFVEGKGLFIWENGNRALIS